MLLAIDTLLVCGTSVSDCVRAAVTGALREIRCVVVLKCVADRMRAMLDANLFDMDQKYAGIVTLKTLWNIFRHSRLGTDTGSRCGQHAQLRPRDCR